MAKLESNEIRRYAVLGAEQRLAQLAEESEQILRAFPELRSRRGGAARGGRPSSAGAAANGTAGQGPARRRRRIISAEGRKRISDAQKARWAKQRGQAESAAASAAPSRKKK